MALSTLNGITAGDLSQISDTESCGVLCGPEISHDEFANLRMAMALNFCKWDPQVGDVSTIAEFPLLISKQTWNSLSRFSENLADELSAMECELCVRPDLQKIMNVPSGARRLFARERNWPNKMAPGRLLRFDFHPTTEGWKVSEVNSDVPGGFAEAWELAILFARRLNGGNPAGDPARSWINAICSALPQNPNVVLLSAPGYLEDMQVVSYLAKRLREFSCNVFIAQPQMIKWSNGVAELGMPGCRCKADVIIRFLQAEWLVSWHNRYSWKSYFVPNTTLVSNPGTSILTETKRLPLVWDDLNTDTPNWKRLLPETREIRDAPWERDENWLIKGAYSNTGDEVVIRELLSAEEWNRIRRLINRHPGSWVAQRRFNPIAISTPRGLLNPCIGVYTVDGKACGAYGRLSPSPIIGYSSIDTALLVTEDTHE